MDELQQRITKLEEAHAFTDHTAEQLHAEVLRAFEAIEKLRHRLDALERRLTTAVEGDEKSDDFR